MWGPPLKKLCVLLLDYLGCFTGSHVKSLYGLIAAMVFFHFLSACEPKPFLSWDTSRFLIPWVGIVYKPDCHCEAQHGHQLGGHYLEEGRAQCTSSHCRGHWVTLLRSELVIVSPSDIRPVHASLENGFTNRLEAGRMEMLFFSSVSPMWRRRRLCSNTFRNSYKHWVKAHK